MGSVESSRWARLQVQEAAPAVAKYDPIIRPGATSGGLVDNPHEINPTYTGTGADTGEWDKDDPPSGTRGLELTVTTREAIDYTNFQLLAFTRVLTFDDAGCLTLVSAETKHVVDTFNVCPEEES